MQNAAAVSFDAEHTDAAFDRALAEIRSCRHCASVLPLGPRPIVRGRLEARLLIISQAPGTRVHETGLSFNDRSGDRLRLWLGLDRDTFYDERRVAIMGMGFCYPGRDARGGDLPPRPECAPLWHPQLRPYFDRVALTLLVGSHAIRHYLPQSRQSTTAVLARWRDYRPEYFVLPHPSWRTTAWERANSWFTAEVLPELRAAVTAALPPPLPGKRGRASEGARARSAPCPRR
jgi:uracil-DNA glycosylase